MVAYKTPLLAGDYSKLIFQADVTERLLDKSIVKVDNSKFSMQDVNIHV